jgi:hypothetical protein
MMKREALPAVPVGESEVFKEALENAIKLSTDGQGGIGSVELYACDFQKFSACALAL